MARNVTYTILKPDGTPWIGAVVSATLTPGSFNTTAHYPSRKVTSEPADEDGAGFITLEPNETFEFPCVWLFEMPDRQTFEAILEDGVDDIPLDEVRALGVPAPSPQYAIIQQYIDAQMDVVTAAINTHTARIDNPHVVTATQLITGTLGDARLSANVPLRNAANSFTQAMRVGAAGVAIAALLHIGDSDVMAAPDSAVLLSRNMTGAGAGHGFADSSTFNRTGTTAYNSFDALPTITGTANYDHYAGFQSRPILQSTGTISYYRGYVSNPSINGPAITNLYHYYVAATGVPALGSVTNQYGLYIASLTAGTALNYAIYTGGNTPSLFGGAVEVQGTITTNAINRATGSFLLQTAGTTRMTVENGGVVTFAATSPVLMSSTLGVTGATALAASLTVVGSTRIGSASAPLAPIHIGTLETNTSVDAAVLVSRSLTGATGAGHCFGDNSTFNRTGNTAYNSYDAQPNITGANSYDHYAGYQTRPIFTNTGTVTDYYGHNSNPLFNGPTVTNAYHYYVSAIGVPATGSIGAQYGLYVAALTGGATNWAVYTAGNTPSLFGGAVTVQGTINVSATATLVGNATVGGTLDVTGVTTVTAALRTDATLRVGTAAIVAGSHIEANSATGTASITPTIIRIRSTSNANDWSTATDYTRLEYYSNDAGIGASVRAAIGARFSNAQGTITDLVFGTSNAAAVADRLRITGAGSVVIGTAALATTATDGFYYIASCAGVATGVPTAYTGRNAMQYDSTNKKFGIYDGGWIWTGALV